MADVLTLNQVKDIIADKVGYPLKWIESEQAEGIDLNPTGYSVLVPESAEVVSMSLEDMEEGLQVEFKNPTDRVLLILFNREMMWTSEGWGTLDVSVVGGIMSVCPSPATQHDLELMQEFSEV